jgi:SAM-dependent methyltransferase
VTGLAEVCNRVTRRAGKLVRPWMARFRGAEGTWQRGLGEEEDHWSRYLATEGDQWPDEYRERLDATTPLAPELTSLLRVADGAPVRILDVGAGPMTILGKVWPGHDVEIVAVDALAERYDALLASNGIVPPVRTQLCHSERLADQFGAESFDLVHARNTLDHGYDPVRAIEQMAIVTAPGGVIVLDHHRDVAEFEAYQGLHQWNLRLEGDTYIAWRPGERRDVMAALGPSYAITRAVSRPDGWNLVAIRKQA